MKISVWHNKLRSWLNTVLAVDAWHPERPQETSDITGFLPPLANVYYYVTNGQTYGSATQQVAVVHRLPKTLKYDQIPLGVYEGIHAQVAIRLVQYYADIADLTSLQLQANNPFALTELSDKTGDWLMTITWSFTLQWLAELETPITTKYDITQVYTAIYRGLLNTQKALDSTTPKVLDNTLLLTTDG